MATTTKKPPFNMGFQKCHEEFIRTRMEQTSMYLEQGLGLMLTSFMEARLHTHFRWEIFMTQLFDSSAALRFPSMNEQQAQYLRWCALPFSYLFYDELYYYIHFMEWTEDMDPHANFPNYLLQGVSQPDCILVVMKDKKEEKYMALGTLIVEEITQLALVHGSGIEIMDDPLRALKYFKVPLKRYLHLDLEGPKEPLKREYNGTPYYREFHTVWELALNAALGQKDDENLLMPDIHRAVMGTYTNRVYEALITDEILAKYFLKYQYQMSYPLT